MTDHERRAFRRRTGFGSRRFGRGSCVRRTPRARHGACLPPPFRAGAAPVTRAAWVAGGLDAAAASGRVPSMEAGSQTHGLGSVGFMSSPSTAVGRSERSIVPASPGFPAWLVSPVSPGGRFWPVVARRFLPTAATPNQALQRTAPARHTGCSRRLRPQPPFRSRCAAPPQSLSFVSLGDTRRFVFNDAPLQFCRESMPAFEIGALVCRSPMSSPSPAVSRSEGSTFSASPSFSASVVSPVSTNRRFWFFLSLMRRADSRFWSFGAWALSVNNVTPNHAIQRTAPCVTSHAPEPPPFRSPGMSRAALRSR